MDKDINLSQLPADVKQQLWQRIKESEPAKAQLMQDPDLKAFMQQFGGEFILSEKEFKEFMK